MKTVDELRDEWNASADHMNQWDELGIDEIVWFAQERAFVDEAMWHDGEPMNLSAAAHDALEWLRHLRDRPAGLPEGSENRKRVADAAAALERFLMPNA